MPTLNRRCQSGFTLLELVLVVALMASMIVMTFAQDQLEFEHKMSKTIGSDLLTYNNAVRKWMSENASSAPMFTVQEGSTWLKPTSCGGTTSRPEGYLDCNFPDYSASNPVKFGLLSLETTIRKTLNSDGEISISAKTLSTPFALSSSGGIKIRSDLAGVAALTAAAGGFYVENPTPHTTDGSFKSDPVTGIITAMAGNNASTDAWLRTDGSNQMHNNLRFNPANPSTQREIKNASRIQNILGQTLFLGNQNGASNTSPDNIVVDADQEIIGKMLLTNTKNHVTALEIRRGNLALKSGTVSASKYYDEDNNAFMIDGDGSSRLYNLKVQRQIDLENSVALGSSCTPSGAISRGSNGEVYSCILGRWSSAGGVTGMYSFFNATSCPTGWVAANGSNGTIDLRGQFVRAWDNGKGVDSGRAVGTLQSDDLKSHNHTATASTDGVHTHETRHTRDRSPVNPGNAVLGDENYYGTQSVWTQPAGAHTHSITVYNTGGVETRPKNASLLACMKL